MADRENWPSDIVTSSTPQSQAEAKVTREIFAVSHVVTDEFDTLLEKFALWKALRVCGWISRFVNNSRKPNKERTKGPLTTEEIEQKEALLDYASAREWKEIREVRRR